MPRITTNEERQGSAVLKMQHQLRSDEIDGVPDHVIVNGAFDEHCSQNDFALASLADPLIDLNGIIHFSDELTFQEDRPNAVQIF